MKQSRPHVCQSGVTAPNLMKWLRFFPAVFCSAFIVATASANQLSDSEMSALRDLIRTQYESVDRNMIALPYQTRNRIAREEDDDLIEITTVNPDRPPGELERLESVNGQPPTASDERRFNRRPQPDERRAQPVRLIIDYDTLVVESRDGDLVTLTFQPVLLFNGDPDDDGEKFRGSLVFDLASETLIQVEMSLEESFSKMFFNISAFTVSETFTWHKGLLVREHYFHDLDMRNRLINLSNHSSITFDYDQDINSRAVH